MDIGIAEKKIKTILNEMDSIIQQAANVNANNIESIPFKITNKNVLSILDNIYFNALRIELGKKLSIEGKASIGIIHNAPTDQYFPALLSNVTTKKLGKTEYFVSASTDETFTYDGVAQTVNVEYYFDEGIPSFRRVIKINIKDTENGTAEILYQIGNVKQFPWMTKLPVKTFYNNFAGESDAQEAGVINKLEILNELSKNFIAEFYRSRTNPIVNNNYDNNDLQETNRTIKQIDEGKETYFVNSSTSSIYQPDTVMSPPLVNAMQSIIQSMLYLKDEVKELLGIARDTVNSGTNQHNLEIIVSQENLLNRNEVKMQFRQEQWNDFFVMLYELAEQPFKKVKLENSLMTQSKLDILKASIVQTQMKKDNINSQRKKTKGDENGN